MNTDKEFLGREPVNKLLWKLAVPTVIAQLVNMLYNIVDRIYIGHIPGEGALALTGVGVCMPLIMVISAFAALVSSDGAPRASISMGKKDYEKANHILSTCLTLLLLISALLTLTLVLFNRQLLLVFGASENTIGYALCSIIVAVVRKFVLLIPLIYLLPALNILGDKAMSVYMAEPVADVLAVTFTSILFFIQFRKALKGLED